MSWKHITNKELIGSGSFGDVFKVKSKSGETGALKAIHKEFHVNRLQFKSAFEAAKKIDDINCLKMYEWISDKEVSWTMEYIDGKPISSLKFTDIRSLDNILKVMIQVCNGLIALHSRNIIHRDLKPENILIDADGIAKITDFDFIKTGFSEKKLGKFIGTPEYSSPEHFISSYELDTRSDIYSLGVILYELLTGELPFTGKTAKEIGDSHRLRPLVLPSKINPEIPEGVEKIIIGLLEKEPKDRYQHAHTVAKDLLKEIKDKKGIKLKSDISYLLKPKFVNRITPLKTLNELSDELKYKKGKVVLILGESGIGKSKLVQQFYYHLQLHNIGFYKSICKTVESSFNPLHKIFEEIIANKSETEKLKCFGEFGWDLVKYGVLTEKEWMNKIEKPVELSGKNAEIRLFSAMTNFIQKAAVKPLVICIDDMHWADEQILKWLKYAERNLKGFPILIIGLHRSEQLFEDSKLLQIENLIQIKIKNLKDIDVSEMIKSMLGKKGKNKEMNNFIENIVSHTKGNPLFIREMLYFLNEKRKISIVNNKWNFPEKLELENLPENIQNVIQERLAELSREALKTLQTASIIGRKFSYEMLLNMTKKLDNELLDDLIDCREVSLIEESGNDYIFIHDKVREVLENEIKEKYLSFWKELHLKAGEFLEEKYSSNPDEVLNDLANHFYFAEHYEKSVKYNELAGDKAKKNYFNNKALNFYEHLIKNIEEKLLILNKKDSNYIKKIEILVDILIKKGNILQLIGNWKEAEEIYKNALKLSEEIKDKKRIANSTGSLGVLHRLNGNYEKAMECYEKSLKISEEFGDKRIISAATENMGEVYRVQGNYPKAMECYEKSLKITEEIGNKKGISTAVMSMGTVYSYLGNYPKMMECYEKSLKITEELGDKSGISLVVGNMGNVYWIQNNYEKAMECYEKQLKISEELGDKRGISRAVGNMGTVYLYLGNYPKAMECYEKQLKISEELGNKRGISTAVGNMGSIYYNQGNYEKAMECFEKELFICEELGDKSGISMAVGNMGVVYNDQGNYEKAMEYYEKSLKICEELGDKKGISHTVGDMGAVYYDQGNYEKAMECYEKRLKISKELGDKRGISMAVGNMGVVYNDQGNYEKAMECYEKQLKISEELGNKRGISTAVGNMGSIYYNQGNYKKAMECFEQALQIDRELSLKPYLTSNLSDKAECFYKMKEYGKANEINEECLKISEEMKDEEHIFYCKVRESKIEFKKRKKKKEKRKNCIEPLEKMLQEIKEEEQIATLNYELAIMNNELNREKNADRHKKKALELYNKIYNETPNINYKNKIEELEKL